MASSARPACSATISLVGPVDPGGGDARGEAAGGVDAELRAEPRDGAQGRAAALRAARRSSSSVGEPGGGGERGEGGEDDGHGVRASRVAPRARAGAPADVRSVSRRTHPVIG